MVREPGTEFTEPVEFAELTAFVRGTDGMGRYEVPWELLELNELHG
jgi:hypothetical protein